ncbi:MAG: VWA domain-containing protein [Deltaproteobacteria bacterium]|nr:VWA domain-containing protein [Deltaproteobacteria bacterium]
MALKLDIRCGFVSALFAGFVGAAIACSSSDEQGLFHGGGGSSAHAGAGGGGATGSGGTISGNGGSGGTLFLETGTPDDAPVEACATSSATASLLPTWLQFLVDISGSMNCQPGDPPGLGCYPGDPGSKWALTRTALQSAIDTLPATTGVGVILFPYVKGGNDLCFSNQAAVPFALLDPAHKQLIQQILGSTSPQGATPTEDAYLFAVQSFTSVPDPSNKFVVLITDGMPTVAKNCQGDGSTPTPTAPLVTDAAAAAGQGIRTFVIGSPGSEQFRSDLSAMAEQGGTGPAGCTNNGPNYCHLDMTTQPDFGKAMSDALQAIASKAISCVFDVPDPGDGGKLDPDKVNVVFTPGGGGPQDVLQNTEPNCKDGWHYSPDGKQIELCEDTCKVIQADGNGKIDIQFGCKTKTTTPR